MKSIVILVVALVGSMSVPLKAQDIPNIQRVDFSYGGDGFDAGEGFEMETGPDGTSFGFHGDENAADESETANADGLPNELNNEPKEEAEVTDLSDEEEEHVAVADTKSDEAEAEEVEPENASSDNREEEEDSQNTEDSSKVEDMPNDPADEELVELH